MKRLFRKNVKLIKGMPSAVVLSILIHAALFLLAGVLVVFTVVKQKEVEFAPPKAVERPKMKLKKPKVRIRKTAKPKPTTRIVTKVQKASMPDIQLPEMSGIGESLSGGVDGFDLIPDLGEVTVFGSGQTVGNDFVGTFYDFKRDRSGRDIPMDPDMFRAALRKFIVKGWKLSVLGRYYQSPKKLYATCFMIPQTLSILGPPAFGEDDTLGYCWAAHYKGLLVCPASYTNGITFRFRGFGDDILLVRVNGELVLNACWPGTTELALAPEWQSTSADSRKYFLGNNRAVVGDWITLEPGVPLDMEVLLGEVGGGGFSTLLVVEVEGVEYEKNRQGGPILPMFKTAEPSYSLMDAIYKDLIRGEACITNGPVFCDYDTSARVEAAEEPENIEPVAAEESDEDEWRTWVGADGKALKARFRALVAGNVVLEDSQGRQKKIPLTQLSKEDRKFIELARPPRFNIDFSKQSSQRILEMSPYSSMPPPRIIDYVFTAKLKQTSVGTYNHELKVEFFAVGASINGQDHILLDHQESSFTPTKENQRSHKFSGRSVETIDFTLDGIRQGIRYKDYLVVVTDERGKIIAHAGSGKWLFENLENLRNLPVGAYMDKTCVRTHPSGLKATLY